jgi:hypothetical protein
MFQKIGSELIEMFVNEIKKEENKKKLNKELIEPVVYSILDRIYPYIIITSIIFLLIFLITTTLLFIIIKDKFAKN